MKTLYVRIYLTLVAVLLAFAFGAAWLFHSHIEQERSKVEAAAGAARVPVLNAQTQEPIVHAPSFTLVRARFDQAVREQALTPQQAADVVKFVDRAEGFAARNKNSAKATLTAKAGQLAGPGQAALAQELRRLADSL